MLELLPPPGGDAATTEDLRREMAQLRAEMSTTRAELIAVFREEVNRAVVTQTRITVFSMVTPFAAVAALALCIG